MRVKALILMLAAGVLALSALSAPVGAQPPIPPLPADLLFTTTLAAHGDYPRNVILRVDAETLELSTFYLDTEAYELAPLSWSPQGDLLAVYRRMPPSDSARTLFPRQLCVLDRSGVLQRCLDDGPPMHYAGAILQDWQHYFPVEWRPDGQTIYFETEYPNAESPGGYGRRIVEASVATGETLQDLNHLTVGFKNQYLGGSNPTFIYDLTTVTQVDPATLVPDHTNMYWTCLPFSPSGHFIAATVSYDLSEYAPELEPPADFGNLRGDLLLLLDPQGVAQHIIGEPEGSPTTIWGEQCPGWQSDEQAIVFLAHNNLGQDYIMRYTLADQQTTPLYELSFGPGRERYAYSPLIPSPDGTHLAFTVRDNDPYAPRQVAVLYPDGEIYRIPSPYRFGLYPLWVPPL
jgi:hypothetical protein